MKKTIWRILRIIRIAAPLQLLISGYLRNKGWYASFYTKTAIDDTKKPIPWISYPCIHFLELRLDKSLDVFEYGSGNSTLWFSQRVNTITSVEHNQEWAEMVKRKLPTNAQLVYVPLVYDGDYSRAIQQFDKKYDIIIIDGRDRLNCLKNAINRLTDRGVILFDNTDRLAYKPAFDWMKKIDFRFIEFEGMTPGTHTLSATTIFYRSNNCLSI